MQLAPKARLDALIESSDARGLVRSIPAEELYQAIVDVGLADATEIVHLASPAQFRTFVDLGGWKRDRVEPLEVLTWLRAARGDSTEEFLAKVHALDIELLEILLRGLVEVHDLEENPDVHPAGVTMQTAEGKYLIEFKVEGVELAAVRQLLGDLIAENPFEVSRFLEAVRWDVPSELEDAAHQFRSARLADLGFPELYQALEIYSFVNPDEFAPPERALGEGLQVSPERVDFVEAAFRGLTPEERENLADEVRYLVNSALVADVAEPGDPAAIRRVSEMARDYLSLGLEHLTGGAPEKAADQVRAHPLKRVFQVGFSLTLKLKFEADRLAREPLARVGEHWLVLDEEGATLRWLRRKRPLRALKVEGAEPVPFRSRRELADSAAILRRAEQQVRVFRALLGGVPDLEAVVAEQGASRLFLAAVVQAILGEPAAPHPLVQGRWVELCERLFEGEGNAPRLRPAALERAIRAIAAQVDPSDHDAVRPMVERVLAPLVPELGAPFVAEGQPPPAEVMRTLLWCG